MKYYFGLTRTLDHHVVAYHCSHSRMVGWIHGANRNENDLATYVTHLSANDSIAIHQKDTWGAAKDVFEQVDRLVQKESEKELRHIDKIKRD